MKDIQKDLNLEGEELAYWLKGGYGVANNINPVNSQAYKNVEARSQVERAGGNIGSTNISVDDFLKIMAAELSNQSIGGEGGGGSKTDYISQLAQLTTLEYIGDLTNSVVFLNFQQEQQFGTSLIGQEVKIMDKDQQIIGVVDRVKFKNGFTMLEIDGKEYYVGNVVETGSGLTIDQELAKPEEIEDPEVIENPEIEELGSHVGENEVDGNSPDTRPLDRSEMTEQYFSGQFLKEKAYYDRYFKDLIKK